MGPERQSPSCNGHFNVIPWEGFTSRQVLTSAKSHFHMLNEQFLRGDKEKKAAIETESTKDLQRRQQLLGNWRAMTEADSMISAQQRSSY